MEFISSKVHEIWIIWLWGYLKYQLVCESDGFYLFKIITAVAANKAAVLLTIEAFECCLLKDFLFNVSHNLRLLYLSNLKTVGSLPENQDLSSVLTATEREIFEALCGKPTFRIFPQFVLGILPFTTYKYILRKCVSTTF